RSGKTVRNITVPVTPMNSLSPDQSAREALRQLSRGGDDALPVITSGEVVGLLKYSDVVKWMSLSGHSRL
ncbi:MAG: CBS domain-containing protein, partial [Moraxellaceae bacterium]|nr:CBS domain-containing protein [Moraxellaceae bacterium]